MVDHFFYVEISMKMLRTTLKSLFLLMMWPLFHQAYAFFPKSFKLSETPGDMAVFVDFQNATYDLNYDVKSKTATYRAKIIFKQLEAGRPLFDVVLSPTKVFLDGEPMNQKEISTPQKESKLRVLEKALLPGEYELVVEGEIRNLVVFDTDSVKAAHWTSDLEDRRYLESYLPSNYEFDQYAMTFQVAVTGTTKEHKIYSNGFVEKGEEANTFVVEFPKYYTSSSGFYHLTPVDVFTEDNFIFESITGSQIPVTVYGIPSRTNFKNFKATTLKTLAELESDYGRFRHPSLVIYNNGSGGMEYCGATMTSHWALSHELTHSYFARGIMPANGNAGWIDEAIATWRDDGYPTRTSLTGNAAMASHQYYTRETDQAAYNFGADFMAYLDGKVQGRAIGNFKSFLRYTVETKIFLPYTTEDFITWLDFYYTDSFAADFKKYVYRDINFVPHLEQNKQSKKRHPIHIKMSYQDLEKFL